MNRENVLVGGCAVIFAMATVLFIAAAVGDYLHPGRDAMFAWAIGIALVGLAVLLVAWAVMLWLDMKRTREAEQTLIERAERLRREREERRRRKTAEFEAHLAALPTEPAPPPRRVISLDDVPADVTLVSPMETTITRATETLGACPLCQTRILEGEEYLSCPACKARYHPDCWEYNQGCAVYGCTVRIQS